MDVLSQVAVESEEALTWWENYNMYIEEADMRSYLVPQAVHVF